MLITDLTGRYKEGYLYFVQMDKVDFIKIGFTSNIEKRMSGLQTASPYELKLLLKTWTNIQSEKSFHDYFGRHCVRGEWFHPVQKIFDEIKDIKHSKEKQAVRHKIWLEEVDKRGDIISKKDRIFRF